jgi:hypothetical protein
MDWNAAIEKNREALKRVLAMLVAIAGLAGFFAGEDGSARRGKAGGHRPTLPRHLHRAVLRLLRPAEAAVRRLVIVMARGLVVKLPPARARKPQPRLAILRNRLGTGILMPRDFRPEAGLRAPAQRTFSLPLLDPLPRWRPPGRPAGRGVPRISFPGLIAPHPVAVWRPPSPNDPVDAARLALRLAALASALDNLPGQARRFAHWRGRRDAACAQDRQGHHKGRARRVWPLRPGRPPGGRQRAVHEVHEVLNVVHGLALWALKSPDTS